MFLTVCDRKRFLACAVVLVLLFVGIRPGRSLETSNANGRPQIQPVQGANPTVLRADATGIALEWRAPALDLLLTQGADGRFYTSVEASGWEQTEMPGQPQLPWAVALIVVPPDGEVTLRSEVFEPQRTLLSHPVVPAPAVIPLGDPPYALVPVWSPPAPPTLIEWVTLEEAGWLRGRRLMRLIFHPLRVDPADSALEGVGRVRVELSFAGIGALETFAVDDSSLLAALQGVVINPAQVPSFGRAAPAEPVTADLPAAAAPSDTEYLIIAHSSLIAAAAVLGDYRAAIDGLRVFSVTAESIYAEYSGGTVSAAAIRDYISATYHSASPPVLDYVLLVGDGSEDAQAAQRIPPFLISDPWGYETGGIAADNRFVTIDGNDPMPDIAIGRLPVSTAAEAAIVIQKILAYEQSPLQWPWNARALFFAGNWLQDPAEEIEFRGHAETLYNDLPDAFTGQRVYFCTTGCTEPYHYTGIDQAAALTRMQLNGGGLLAVYSGHSSEQQWVVDPVTWKPLFHVNDVAGLHNGGALPVFVQMTCYTSRFGYPDHSTLDESLLRLYGGGAVATWGSTNLGRSSGHEVLGGRFFDAVFNKGWTELGQATTSAKLALLGGNDLDLLDSFVLFGDPAMNLNMSIVPWAQHVFLPLVLR